MKRLIALVCVVLSFAALDAQAIPVTWTFTGVQFTDGGTASGTFVYDADTNTYSALNITAAGGTNPTLNTTYAFVCVAPCTGLPPTSGSVLNLTVTASSNLTGLPAFALTFSAPLSNAGGSRGIAGSLNATCNNPTCSAPIAPGRTVATGAIASALTPIPTLSDWGLVILVLMIASLVAFGRKRPWGR